jgi:hypothetical protein
MSLDITPGSAVQVKVTRNPTNEQAAKTLSRVFLRDPDNRKAARRRKRILFQQLRPKTRGGRIWVHHNHAPRMFQPQSGDACSIQCVTTVDLNDLASVSRFVEVAAK